MSRNEPQSTILLSQEAGLFLRTEALDVGVLGGHASQLMSRILNRRHGRSEEPGPEQPSELLESHDPGLPPRSSAGNVMQSNASTGLSDVGRRRKNNEDAFFCDDELGLYVVCDGVGGNAKGEVASAESVALVHGWVKRWRGTVENFVAEPSRSNCAAVRRVMENAVQSACYMVFGMGLQDPQQRGMSTTLSSLLIAGGSAFIAQVGDSRVYLHRHGEATQLTEDHTLVNFRLKLGLITPEEAENAPGKNVITRAVGHQDHVEVDCLDIPLQAGDRLMLCSDGLHGYLEEGELDARLEGERAAVCQSLIDMANERGGRDNVTAVVVDPETA